MLYYLLIFALVEGTYYMMFKSKKRKIVNCYLKDPSYVDCKFHKEDKNPGDFIPLSSVRGSPSDNLHSKISETNG